MSTEFVLGLVTQAINEIDQNIRDLEPPANEEKILNAVNDPIKTAFSRVRSQYLITSQEKEADIKLLYRKLSLKLHPDKLVSNSDDYAVMLRENEAFLQIPQRVIEDNKNAETVVDLFHRLNTDRYNTIKEMSLKVIVQLLPIYNEYLRYPEPIRSIVNYSRLVIIAGLAFVGLVGVVYVTGDVGSILVCIDLGLEYFNKVNVDVLNIVTQNAYDDELLRGITREKMADFARDELFNSHRIDADGEDDEQAISSYVERFCTVEYQLFQSSLATLIRKDEIYRPLLDRGISDELRQTITDILHENDESIRRLREEFVANTENTIKMAMKKKTYGMEHVYAVFNAFSHAITKPLPDEWTDILTSVCLRMAQAILMLPMLTLEATTQLLNIVVLTMDYVLLAAAALLFGVPVVLLSNLPLYIYDGLSAVINWASSVPEATATAVPRSDYGRMFTPVATPVGMTTRSGAFVEQSAEFTNSEMVLN